MMFETLKLTTTRPKFFNHTSRLCIYEIGGVIVRKMELLRSYNFKAAFGDPDWMWGYNHDCNFETVSDFDLVSSNSLCRM